MYNSAEALSAAFFMQRTNVTHPKALENLAKFGAERNLLFYKRKVDISKQFIPMTAHEAERIKAFQPNTPKKEETTLHQFKRTDLLQAVADNDIVTVERLIKSGANIYAQDSEGHTPLSLSENYGYDEITEVIQKAMKQQRLTA